MRKNKEWYVCIEEHKDSGSLLGNLYYSLEETFLIDTLRLIPVNASKEEKFFLKRNNLVSIPYLKARFKKLEDKDLELIKLLYEI